MSLSGLRLALLGPLPPPSGGMANQTRQLADLLRADGATVHLLQLNAPLRPAWLARVKGLRAAARLTLYVWRLWRVSNTVDLFHVMANSGWSWHLYAAPAIWIARMKGKALVVNYRGGGADAFFARRAGLVGFSLRRADAVLVPSAYLAGVFEKYGFPAQVVPNIIDLSRFAPRPPGPARSGGPRLLVARNLEAIYDNTSALRAFAIVRQSCPDASLVLAGDGAELGALQELARELGLAGFVRFAGRIENADMAALYHASDIVLNPSLADNMPISVLEALACGVPVVSTNVGGVPALLRHDATALLVEPGDVDGMARALLALIGEPHRAARLAAAGLEHVAQFSWPRVAPRLLAQYRRALGASRPGLYTTLVSSLLFPLHEKLKRHDSAALLARMEGSQWWSAARLEQLQLTRLRALLTHAQAHVPYYRERFAAIGFDAARVDSLADLQGLPTLLKADISARPAAFKSALARHLAPFNTGGSSGVPLSFFIGKERVSHDVAAKWRATRWWGVDIGDREVVIWGSPIELKVQDRVRALRDRLLRSTLLPAFDLAPAKLDGLIRRIRQVKPKMLFGYPSVLTLIARHARAQQQALDGLGVRVVFLTSERLYDDQRALVEAVFACRVANGYGGRDAGFIAHECPEGGMHITAEDIIVEILDAHGRPVARGESGAIHITNLATRDFPFIRYATGDVGALASEACPCGRGLPLLKYIHGRSTDFVVTQDQAVIHGAALVYVLRELPQIREFKIFQESLTLTRVLLVAVPELDQATRQMIERRFKGWLGAEVVIVIEEVAEIAPEASGKFRYIISKVAPT
ncbi:MAG TPA: capsular biosynthesis protein [Janthinobacterium sp.]|nr:capsular biosynthesis protein [Janthinobacterium sp.]